jgi:hypothetical protein
MPVVIQHNATFISLFALDINEEFKYPKYFSMLPVGPDPRPAITEGFFELIKANKEKLGLKTIAIATGDGEATRNGSDGARSQRQEGRARDRLRQDLSADDDRFQPDHPRHPGDQCRCRADFLLSERQRRHHPQRQRARASTC